MHMTFEEIKTSGEGIMEFLQKELNVVLSFNRETVEWIDGYISRNRAVFSEERRYGWAVALGYIIGEAMVREFGGNWEYDEEQDEWLVKVGPNKAYPIRKTYKYLTDPADSVASFFRAFKLMLEKGGIDKFLDSQTKGTN